MRHGQLGMHMLHMLMWGLSALAIALGTGGCGDEPLGPGGVPGEDADTQVSAGHYEGPIQAGDFVGTWTGEVTNSLTGLSETETATLELSRKGDRLTGILVTDTAPAYTVNGTFGLPTEEGISFNLSPENPLDPECRSMMVLGAAGVELDRRSMVIGYSGIFCGPGGGNFGLSVGRLQRLE